MNTRYDLEMRMKEQNWKGILEALRLAFEDLPDDAEIVITSSNPFQFGSGDTVYLQSYSLRHPNDKINCRLEFTAATHMIDKTHYVILLADKDNNFMFLREESQD